MTIQIWCTYEKLINTKPVECPLALQIDTRTYISISASQDQYLWQAVGQMSSKLQATKACWN